jgi:hypothetical protein
MLYIKRTPGQAFHILPSPDLDPDMRVSDLFSEGGIEVLLTKSQGAYASFGIDAPEGILILREELFEEGEFPK